MRKIVSQIATSLVIILLVAGCHQADPGIQQKSRISPEAISEVTASLLEKYGTSDQERITRGIAQLAKNWWPEDGTEKDFVNFCKDNLMSGNELSENFRRICSNRESLNGHLAKIAFSFNESERFTDVEELKADPFYRSSFPSMNPYQDKLAQFIQLNFPYYPLEDRRKEARDWSRDKWAMVTLGNDYRYRADPGFKRAAAEESAAFSKYMAHYFLRMDHICLEDGTYPFPPGTLLHSHRGLRDDCKEEYTRSGGYGRQKLIGKVIEHIVLGTVPKQFLTDTTTRWNPWTHTLTLSGPVGTAKPDTSLEGPVRYAGFRSEFLNRSSEDPLYQPGSTVITRTFHNQNSEPGEVEKMIRDLLGDPVIAEAGKIIEKQLGRPLEPFDIWYSGFQEQSAYPADRLDSITMARYPDPATFQQDLPAILEKMGFPQTEAIHIGNLITVRPVVSGGYTDAPVLKGDKVLMTTMFSPKGLDYKAYRVAMHELGHAVCMVYTADECDPFILADVPSGGITEGFAEFMAYKNIEGLGLKPADPAGKDHLLALASLWYLVDMGGQALTDIETWKWIYAHPKASATEVQQAVLKITADIWNQYFASVFGGIRDQHILSIYNHYITGSLYLFNYFIGNVVAFQLHDACKSGDMAGILKNACREGNTLPEIWMEKAVGRPVSIEPLMEASRKAIRYFQGN
jgi:hypothetical protein